MAWQTSQFSCRSCLVPWASQEVQRPVQDMPSSYFMAIFDLQDLSDDSDKENNLCNMFLKIGHFQKEGLHT